MGLFRESGADGERRAPDPPGGECGSGLPEGVFPERETVCVLDLEPAGKAPGAAACLSVVFFNGKGEKIRQEFRDDRPKSVQWRKLSLALVPPEETAYAYVSFFGHAGDQAMIFDDFSITEESAE